MLENPQHTFWLKLLSVNFLFMSSIWTGKSFFYILADFALFAFIVTLIYVHVVSFLEKKNLAQSEKEVEFVSRDMISEVVSPIVQKLNSLLTVVLSATLKQSLVVGEIISVAYRVVDRIGTHFDSVAKHLADVGSLHPVPTKRRSLEKLENQRIQRKSDGICQFGIEHSGPKKRLRCMFHYNYEKEDRCRKTHSSEDPTEGMVE